MSHFILRLYIGPPRDGISIPLLTADNNLSCTLHSRNYRQTPDWNLMQVYAMQTVDHLRALLCQPLRCA